MGTQGYKFIDENGSFELHNPEAVSGLYFPIANELGLKSAVTPLLGGDSKLDQNSFLLAPESIEDLHNSRATRNFWCSFSDGKIWSATGVSAEAEAARFTEAQEESTLRAGLMWQTVSRKNREHNIESEITSFVALGHNAEVMRVELKNTGTETLTINPIAAIPIYGRSADNIRDHRHVTSLLHRIKTTENGVTVKPTLSFDERGHLPNHKLYYALGIEGDGTAPIGTYPTVESFIGEGGSFTHPRAALELSKPKAAGTLIDGREAMGSIRFAKRELAPSESAVYIVLLGITEDEAELPQIINELGTAEKIDAELERVRAYWLTKADIHFHTGNTDFDGLMRWIAFQPTLRRLYGCSFLPHHDYGKGGRGWRDLWQDCLALLLMEPGDVGERLVSNFAGVRLDGTNATIIGSKQGEFVADRNGIVRVWMDHGFWPWLTVKLYLDETGDLAIMDREVPYFKDAIAMRGAGSDDEYDEADGCTQRTSGGAEYRGTLWEHILVENLTAFYDVGEHNELLLHNADWNDALDMASHRGESVAFTAAYAGNLTGIAEALSVYSERTGKSELPLFDELLPLMEDSDALYESIEKKREKLHSYAASVAHSISGKRTAAPISGIIDSLTHKSEWMKRHIRETEWIADGADGWINSYYDDHGRSVEGISGDNVRMMLTGQVFAIMSGTADDAQTAAIIKSADKYLYDETAGGYRLNTDFGEVKDDLGRMFGFAYGEKENGAVFSHMAVMYAWSLYNRGFAEAGRRVLRALSNAALNFETGKIYPGIPEYFSSDGRGMYHYLTGAASWYLYAMTSQVFGVGGSYGDLVIAPQLSGDEFDANGEAKIELSFAGKRFEITVTRESGERKVIRRDEIEAAQDEVIKIQVGNLARQR